MYLPAMIILQRNSLTSPRSVFKIKHNNSSIVSVCSGHREPFHRSEFCIHLRASVLHWLAYTEWVGILPICAQYQSYLIKTSFLIPSCSQKTSFILWTMRYFCIFPILYTLHLVQGFTCLLPVLSWLFVFGGKDSASIVTLCCPTNAP